MAISYGPIESNLEIGQTEVSARDFDECVEPTPWGDVVAAQSRGLKRLEPARPVAEETFESLYRRHFPRLVRYCSRRTVDRAAAEDIAQEALCRVLLHERRLDLETPIWPWLKTVASHLISDEGRVASREVALASRSASAPDHSAEVDQRVLLEQALHRLNNRHQTALRLRYYDGWSRAEVGGFLGLSGLAVDQLLFRARARLRDEYDKLARGLSGVVLGFRFAARRQMDRVQYSPTAPTLAQITSGSGAQMLAAIAVAAGGLQGAQAIQVEMAPRLASSSSTLAEDHANRLASRLFQPERTWEGSTAQKNATAEDSVGKPGVHDPEEIARDVLDPNRDVRQPEDARIGSFAYRPSSHGSGELYAAGQTSCSSPNCPPVLFRSRDDGRSWRRLPAKGLVAEQLLVPQDSSVPDLLFAIGRNGLQVSEDGGRTFGPTSSIPAAVAGAGAISPTFGRGDPTILIGAQTLMQYRHDTGTTAPVAHGASVGRVEPAFSPAYAEDNTIYLGGVSPDPTSGRMATTVWTCRQQICASTSVAGLNQVPKLRFSTTSGDGRVILFTQSAVSVSDSFAQLHFRPIDIPLGDAAIEDVEAAGKASLVVTTRPTTHDDRGGSVLLSRDNGRTWNKAVPRLFQGGAGEIISVGGNLFVALDNGGLMCSGDRGHSWTRRCQ